MKYERQYVDFSKVCQLIITVSNPYHQTDKDTINVLADALIRDLERVATKSDFDL